MPFRSRAQQRFAFGTGRPWAKRWATQTDFATLPEHKDAGTDAGAPLSGPGGLLSTPGLGSARKRKGTKWGKRTKAVCTCGIATKDGESLGPGITRIRGNLCNVHGRYGPCDAGQATARPKGRKGRAARPKKPKKVALTPEQRASALQAKRQQNADAVAKRMADSDTGLSPSGSKAMLAFANGTPPDAQTGAQLAQLGLTEQASDGSYRMTPTGHAAVAAMQSGDYQRAIDAISRGTDTSAKRIERQAARAQRQQAAATRRAQAQATREQVRQARAKRQAGGGKQVNSKNPLHLPPAPRSTQVAKPARVHASAPKGPALAGSKPKAPAKAPAKTAASKPSIAQPLKDAASALSTGADVTNAQIQQLVTNGLAKIGKDGKPVLTASGLRATTKATMSVADQNDLPDSAFLFIEAGGKKDSSGKTVPRSLRHFPYKDASGGIDLPHLRNAIARIPQSNAKGLNKTTLQKRAQTLLAKANASTEKSFIVFKDASGTPRWLARTTTAYQDRDGEIISEAALDQDSQRMTATRTYGPLRWWHVGDPDPAAPDAPWGPGLDIGDCDYSTVIGRTRVESGTFRDPQIAQKVAAAADGLEMSPGFFHPLDQPDSAGVFHTIRTFERSVVPTRYGRASNLFTGFTVKEFRMDSAEMEKRFKAMYTELGLTPEQGKALGDQLIATEKAAQQQGIAYKSNQQPYTGDVRAAMDTPQTVYVAADGTPGIIVNGMFSALALKAAPPPPAADAAPMDASTPADEILDGPDDETAEEGEYLGDMTVADFEQMMAQLLAPVLKMQDMVKSMGDMHSELKGMYGGMATKDAGVQAEIATLKARLSELEGSQPNTVLPDEVAAALKSAGPAQAQKPGDPEKQQILNDPNRPFAWLGMQTFPELYNQNGANE